MSDLISRQAALAELDKAAWGKDWDKALAAEMLKSLPSAQQWIPVSERLPNEGQVVLTQAKFKHDVKFCVSSRQDFNYWTGWNTREINVVAWMYIPEPWEGESE